MQTRQHVVALTFDGGGNADAANKVLAVLNREHVTGELVLMLMLMLMQLGSSRDRSIIDSRALPGVFRAARARGYRFVTLAVVRAPAR